MASVTEPRTAPALPSDTKVRRPARSLYERRRRQTGFLYVIPSLLFVTTFFLLPLATTMWMSLHNWPLLGRRRFTGIANYQRMVTDDTFWSSLWFTARYTLLATASVFLVGFGLALLVRQTSRRSSLLRTAYFIPVIIGLAAASFLWVWLFNEQVGVANWVFQRLGLIDEPIQWLQSPGTALLAIVLLVTWKTSGFAMLMFLVGMHSIPEELYEAAAVDGASRWASIRHITVPLLRPTFALVLVLLITGSYLAFDQFFIMTRGGPQNATVTVVYWIFQNAFIGFRLGYGAALAVVLLLVLVAINSVQLYLVRRDPTEAR